MKRFLLIFVVFANLFTGFAFAADMHPGALAGYEQAAAVDVMAQSGNGQIDDNAAHSCDHCCHGAAHLTGMTSAAIVFLMPQGDRYHPVLVQSLLSCFIPPHLRPPIA